MQLSKNLLLLGLLAMVGCEQVGAPKLSTQQSPELLRSGATMYALVNSQAIRANFDITVNGVTLLHGQQLGQSMHPTIDQLKAMGYVAPNYSLGGDVIIKSDVRACAESSNMSACPLYLTTTVHGVRRIEGIGGS